MDCSLASEGEFLRLLDAAFEIGARRRHGARPHGRAALRGTERLVIPRPGEVRATPAPRSSSGAETSSRRRTACECWPRRAWTAAPSPARVIGNPFIFREVSPRALGRPAAPLAALHRGQRQVIERHFSLMSDVVWRRGCPAPAVRQVRRALQELHPYAEGGDDGLPSTLRRRVTGRPCWNAGYVPKDRYPPVVRRPRPEVVDLPGSNWGMRKGRSSGSFLRPCSSESSLPGPLLFLGFASSCCSGGGRTGIARATRCR